MAVEVCDGIDNDCNGATDEDFAPLRQYPDADGDGFGRSSDATVRCEALPGHVPDGGDCDDTRAVVYPGAADLAGDGFDADCGGTDAAQPSVGLPTSASVSIQAALDAASPGETVWVGPGHYLERDLSFRGKAVVLASTRGAAATVIDAETLGRVFIFDQAEGAGTVLRGFTLTGGFAERGGALATFSSSPTLEALVLTGNEALGAGGGFYLEAGAPALRDLRITENECILDAGGGGYIAGCASVKLERLVFERNEAYYSGGGLGVGCAYLTVTGSEFRDNVVLDGRGGGVSWQGAWGSIRSSWFSGNRAEELGNGYDADGGALHASGERLALHDSTFVDNVAEGSYDGLYVGGMELELVATTTAPSSTDGLNSGMLASSTAEVIDCHFAGGRLTSSNTHLTMLRSEFPQATRSSLYLSYSDARVVASVFDGGSVMGDWTALTSADSLLAIDRCAFTGNSSDWTGALRTDGGSAQVSRTLFDGNLEPVSGWQLHLVDSSFIGNTEGAVRASASTLIRCTFEQNVGYILIHGDDLTIRECLIAGNSNAWGIVSPGGHSRIERSVIVGNTTDSSNGTIELDSSTDTLSVHGSILAYNTPYNFYLINSTIPTPEVMYSDVFGSNKLLDVLDPSNLTVEPGFLSYGADGLPTDYHLARTSPLIDAGEPTLLDPDGSRSDMGIYAGPAGGERDQDDDGSPDWFWPGTIEDAPDGFNPADYDRDDRDPAVH